MLANWRLKSCEQKLPEFLLFVILRTNYLARESSIMNNKIDRILLLLQEQQRTQRKLEDHIDFVETTYDTLKSPLNFVKDKINAITGSKTRRQLPDFPCQITQGSNIK